MKFAALAVLSSLLFVGPAHTQTRPDFSGRWTVAVDSSSAPSSGRRGGGPPPTIGSGWGPDITLAQDANTLKLEYAFFTRSDMQPPHRFTFALDGSETTARLMLGRGIEDLKSRATWNQDKLNVVTTQMIPDPAGSGKQIPSEVRRTLSLDSPQMLRIVTVRSGIAGTASTTTQTLYRKQ